MSDLPRHIKIYKEGLIGKADATKYREEYRMDELDKEDSRDSVIVQFGPETLVTETFLEAFFWPSLEAGQRYGMSEKTDIDGVLMQVHGGLYQLVKHSQQTDKQFGEIWHDLINLGYKFLSYQDRQRTSNPSPGVA